MSAARHHCPPPGTGRGTTTAVQLRTSHAIPGGPEQYTTSPQTAGDDGLQVTGGMPPITRSRLK